MTEVLMALVSVVVALGVVAMFARRA